MLNKLYIKLEPVVPARVAVSRHSVIAVVLVFLVVAGANVIVAGFGQVNGVKLALAVGLILAIIGAVVQRARRFQALDELQQRMELEALAAAFTGSFLIFVSYWLLQLAGLLPPLDGMYYMLGMISLLGVGSGSAWSRLARKPMSA